MNKETNEWLEKAAASCKDRIEQSDVYAGLVTKNFMSDPMCALQLGYAVLFDKPIILLVDKDVEIPKSVVRTANLIQRIDINNQKWADEATKAIAEFTAGIK